MKWNMTDSELLKHLEAQKKRIRNIDYPNPKDDYSTRLNKEKELSTEYLILKEIQKEVDRRMM